MVPICAVLASSADDSGGWGFLVIAATVLAVVLVIAAVWTLAARRAGRTPRRTPQREDHGVRGS